MVGTGSESSTSNGDDGSTGSEPTATGSASSAAGTTTTAAADDDASAGDDMVLDTLACEAQMFCEPGELAPVMLEGTTDLGPVALDYAWFGVQEEQCMGALTQIRIVWSSEGLMLPDWEMPPGVDVLTTSMEAMLGEQSIVVELHRGDEATGAAGTAELTMLPADPWMATAGAPPRVQGTITVVGDGWDLQGDFDAALCREVDEEGVIAE